MWRAEPWTLGGLPPRKESKKIRKGLFDVLSVPRWTMWTTMAAEGAPPRAAPDTDRRRGVDDLAAKQDKLGISVVDTHFSMGMRS